MVESKNIKIENRSLSVVIPTRDSSEFIKKTIESLAGNIQDLIREIVIVVPQTDLITIDVLASLSGPYPIKIIQTATVLGQHEGTIMGILHTAGPLVLTMDDDIIFNDDKLVSILKDADLQRDTFFYLIQSQYSLKERLKMSVVRQLIRWASGKEFRVKAGSSQRLFHKDLLISGINKHDLNHYLDALIPGMGYRCTTITTSYLRIKHNSRHTLVSRLSLLFLAIRK